MISLVCYFLKPFLLVVLWNVYERGWERYSSICVCVCQINVLETYVREIPVKSNELDDENRYSSKVREPLIFRPAMVYSSRIIESHYRQRFHWDLEHSVYMHSGRRVAERSGTRHEAANIENLLTGYTWERKRSNSRASRSYRLKLLWFCSRRAVEDGLWGEVFHGQGENKWQGANERREKNGFEYPRLSRQTRLPRDSMDPAVFPVKMCLAWNCSRAISSAIDGDVGKAKR